MRSILCVTILVGLMCLPVHAAAQEKLPSSKPELHNKYEIQKGKHHFDFVLPNIEDGKPVYLSQFRGKKVLLIHFASW